jgi:hypothetical protein
MGLRKLNKGEEDILDPIEFVLCLNGGLKPGDESEIC